MGSNNGKEMDPAEYMYVEEEEEEKGLSSKTYLEQVSKKIHSAFPKKGKREVSELAQVLVNKKEMKQRYFNHLLKRTNTAIDVAFEEAKAFPDGYQNEAVKNDSQERIASGIDRVKHLEVKLLLFELKDEYLKQQLSRYFHKYVHRFTYGPLHVSIQIGNVILEWGTSSLVIPRSVPSSQRQSTKGGIRLPIFSGTLHEVDNRHLPTYSVREIPVRAGEEQMKEGLMKQVNVLLDISQEKEYLIDELTEVAVRYNKHYHYGLFSCNCQHFALDVLKVLGISNHNEAFKGRLREHAEVLMKRGLDLQAEFNSHKDLDEYVQANIDRMSPDELEFCYCHYLLFHAWNRKWPKHPAWQCDSQTCQCARIERQLD